MLSSIELQLLMVRCFCARNVAGHDFWLVNRLFDLAVMATILRVPG